MLRKLIKHELIATARTMLPIFAAVLVAAIGTHFAAFSPSRIPAVVPAWLTTLVSMLFVISIFAAFIAAFVLMIRRFYNNLLRDEGYLTMTLPVSVHEHIFAKVIVSVLWSLATVLVVCAAFMILIFNFTYWGDLFSLMREILQAITKEGLLLQGIGIGLELLALVIVGAAGFCLEFYAAMAIGHSFTSRKGLWSFVAYFALQLALQAVYTLIANVLGKTDLISYCFDLLENSSVATTLESGAELAAPSFAGIHVFLLALLAIFLFEGAAYYAVTAHCLKNRLNLN